jgi:hypothetical protein
VVGFGLLTCVEAQAQTISSGTFTVGIGLNGELYNAQTGIGFLRNSDSYDPLAPGTPRDSWGVETNLGAAYGDGAFVGVSNVTSTNQTFGASSATSTSVTSVGVTVGQTYSFLQPNILQVTETITNTSGSTLTGVVLQRDVDWDVSPTPFNENSFGNPITANVNNSSYYGFENPDPSVPYGLSCAAGCNNTGDLGGGINVTLGTLASGASVTQIFLYGINQSGESVNGLIGDVVADGAYYWVATQSSENGSYPDFGENSAIIAVAQVPEPATWALMLAGFAGLGFAGHRARASRVALG